MAGDDFMVLAIDIGGTKVMVALVDQEGRIFHLHKEESQAILGKQALMQQVFRLADAWLQVDSEKVQGIGVTVPGIADSKAGVLKYAPYSGLSDLPIKDLLKDKYDLPVHIDNDVNACAWGEKWFGAAKECGEFVWMTISTGIGGAIVTDGRLMTGYDGMAGEYGHMVIDEKGERCGCGARGCLETMAAGPAWVREIKKAVQAGKKTQLSQYDLNKLTAKEIAEAARVGDGVAVEVVKNAAVSIGRALSWVINVLNPEQIFLGGGLMEADDLLLPGIRKEAYKRAISARYRKIPIVKTSLGYQAALLGAAALVLHSEK